MCGQPERILWTYGSLPPLETVDSGNWISLQRCAECSAYWCAVPHEPYAAFTFVTLWPYDAPAWRKIHDLDNGQSLNEWHDAVIREAWNRLPPSGLADIEAWRQRTYFEHNPIDMGSTYDPPRRIFLADDLKRVVEAG